MRLGWPQWKVLSRGSVQLRKGKRARKRGMSLLSGMVGGVMSHGLV